MNDPACVRLLVRVHIQLMVKVFGMSSLEMPQK